MSAISLGLDELIRRHYDQVVGITKECGRLVDLCDMLLSKLISAKLRVNDVSKLTEVAK